MCGIGGIISLDKKKAFNEEIQQTLIKLLKELQTRGRDAWGMYLRHVDEKNHYYCFKEDKSINGEVFKLSGSVSNFFNEKDGVIDTSNLNLALLHTRAATHGDSDKNENNHPFNTKRFILAHNGGISNNEVLIRREKLDVVSECDSEVIVSMIQKHVDNGDDVAKAIKKTAEKLRGAFSCWLYDKKTDDIYFFKRTRPFEYFYDKERNIFIFASTASILSDAYEHATYSDCITLKENTIFKFAPDKLVEVDTFKDNNDKEETSIVEIKCNDNDIDDKFTINSNLTNLFNMLEDNAKKSDITKISRIFDDIIVISTSRYLYDAVEFAPTICQRFKFYENGKEMYRVKFAVDNLVSVLNILGFDTRNKHLMDDSEDDYFEDKLCLVCEDLGLDVYRDTNAYVITGDKISNYTKNLFSDYGLNFSKKGTLTIKFKSKALSSLKKLMKEYAQMGCYI